MKSVEVTRGNSPLVLGQPHGGTFVPSEVWEDLNDRGQSLADTDWHISRLYDNLVDDVTVVKATFHRYVIDANRDPSDVSLYPGQNTTSLCPTTDFDGNSIWISGREPNSTAIEKRKAEFHARYHNALMNELHRVRSINGFAILYDCHSIRSEIPFLFEGTLPVFSVGTNCGTTCNSEIENFVMDICQDTTRFDCILNGRFKGGWTTRNYGNPDENIHAIQMELSQSAYMMELPPWQFSAEGAAALRPYLQRILDTLKKYRPAN